MSETAHPLMTVGEVDHLVREVEFLRVQLDKALTLLGTPVQTGPPEPEKIPSGAMYASVWNSAIEKAAQLLETTMGELIMSQKLSIHDDLVGTLNLTARSIRDLKKGK